ncbi:hypothetical protein E2R68_09110 [Psychromonas sp. RZ22]|uniref:hypothetical protein n=1 Tax=Psychromonas algarum TaxID=2555643 RepID=UPI001067E62D|nr:hypothetical protein [Psychromonas sp. RZ22]TEW54422.1 hypothetical protein E2R68_09110 [Psychromonas sp. RZ22]
MLITIANYYTPLLALFCVCFLNSKMNKQLGLSFLFAFFYIYSFAFIEARFSWWSSMGGDFSSHTAATMVMVCALLSFNYKVGLAAFISMLGYGWVMTMLSYHSWFDIFTTILACIPCIFLFFSMKDSKTKGNS